MRVHVIGAGLAGCEAAFLLAERGIEVTLSEMRPLRATPAHKTDQFAELVCSNSFKSDSADSAPGALKRELEAAGSVCLRAARATQVPAGEALAVDRDRFSEEVTRAVGEHPRIRVVREEVSQPSAEDGATIVATGPLTSDSLGRWIARATGETQLYFYDAISPIVDTASIDRDRIFEANRHDRGEEAAYLNCPMSEPEYEAFRQALLAAEKVPPRGFEKEILYSGCQPIEAIAASGPQSLRHGPMKPIGLVDPSTGKPPFAVVQLRPENRARTAYNLVGFQTKLKYGEQGRVLRLIPALAKAEFLRLGSIHRNTYVCSPRALAPDLSLRGNPRVYLAGQITGVEGYLESAASGWLAGLFAWQRLAGLPHRAPPASTAMGALLRHVTGGDPERFQPSGIHFGLLDPAFFEGGGRAAISRQAAANFRAWHGHSGATS